MNPILPATMQGAPLPDLSGDYTLTPDQIAAYQRDGHILLRQIASREEIAAYRPAILEVAQREMGDLTPLHERGTHGQAFVQLFHFFKKDERLARLVLARRFAKIAADIMGVDVVRLYHDQVLFKEPGGGPTPWHQDQYYMPLDTPNILTMWIPLVDVAAEMGTLTFASGSHRGGPLLDLGLTEEADTTYQNLLAEERFAIVESGAMAAGDATFHTGWTVHRASANNTSRMREVLTILYFADGARLRSDVPIAAAIGRQHLGGRAPGELVDSELNPIVFRRQER